MINVTGSDFAIIRFCVCVGVGEIEKKKRKRENVD